MFAEILASTGKRLVATQTLASSEWLDSTRNKSWRSVKVNMSGDMFGARLSDNYSVEFARDEKTDLVVSGLYV